MNWREGSPSIKKERTESLGSKWQELEATTGRAAYSYCRFCQNNGESAEIFLSHVTKESSGAVQCPVLRSYKCPVCWVTGNRAHTVSYCLGTGRRRIV